MSRDAARSRTRTSASTRRSVAASARRPAPACTDTSGRIGNTRSALVRTRSPASASSVASTRSASADAAGERRHARGLAEIRAGGGTACRASRRTPARPSPPARTRRAAACARSAARRFGVFRTYSTTERVSRWSGAAPIASNVAATCAWSRLGGGEARGRSRRGASSPRRRVLERGRRVVRQLADEREARRRRAAQPVVGARAGLDERRRILAERRRQVVVRVGDAEELVDGRRERLCRYGTSGSPRWSGRPCARDERVQRPVERGTIVGDVEVDAAEARVVERVEELGPHALHDAHDGLRLRARRREAQRLVVDREAPLDLLAMRRPIEVPRVVQRRELALEPALVQHEAVRIGDGDRVERRRRASRRRRSSSHSVRARKSMVSVPIGSFGCGAPTSSTRRRPWPTVRRSIGRPSLERPTVSSARAPGTRARGPPGRRADVGPRAEPLVGRDARQHGGEVEHAYRSCSELYPRMRRATISWLICCVPSKMSLIFASRIHFSSSSSRE